MKRTYLATLVTLTLVTTAAASSEPQVKTDHPFYPGELACSTFQRLFQTQAELYTRVTGRPCQSDEDRALAAWYWRNLHYAHGEEGKGDYFGQGFTQADWNREYWTGLFAHGFGLCGTTHSQWTAEMDALLGHCRSRCVGVSGHNSFEVFLTGGNYGAGRWVLLDHDISTVILAPDGSRLLSIQEIAANLKNLANPSFKPERQHGWRVSGLHDDDARGVYDSFRVAEYLDGYAGPPPMVHLRSGETLRRYLRPGLDDAKTFVFWGMNYRAAGIPGPQRDRTWVNQPQNMFGSEKGTGWNAGQVRFANAVYTYAPNFADGSYKQGVIDEAADHVTFEFYTPYVIAATPANDKPWGIYDPGGKNGLIVSASEPLQLAISIDQGRSWQRASLEHNSIDLTDIVKGSQQYLLRFDVGADKLRSAKVSWRTVCQCNSSILPRLHDGQNTITFASSDQALMCAGPFLSSYPARSNARTMVSTAEPLRSLHVSDMAILLKSGRCRREPRPTTSHSSTIIDANGSKLP